MRILFFRMSDLLFETQLSTILANLAIRMKTIILGLLLNSVTLFGQSIKVLDSDGGFEQLGAKVPGGFQKSDTNEYQIKGGIKSTFDVQFITLNTYPDSTIKTISIILNHKNVKRILNHFKKQYWKFRLM